jgi:type III pantothenate kinase
MLLLVDCGNTRIKWGWGRGNQIDVGEPFPTGGEKLDEHLNRSWQSLSRPQAVWAASVACPEIAHSLETWVMNHWGLMIHWAQAEACGFGVINGYEQPEKLGVDRWLSLIAVRQSQDLPSIVVSCGTALTLDVLDTQGRHLGGVIAPGLGLMKRSLVQETHGINVIEDEAGDFFLGRTTAAGIARGSLYAAVGLIEKILHEATKLLNSRLILFLSGGDAEWLAAHLKFNYRLRPHLVLEGLMILGQAEYT